MEVFDELGNSIGKIVNQNEGLGLLFALIIVVVLLPLMGAFVWIKLLLETIQLATEGKWSSVLPRSIFLAFGSLPILTLFVLWLMINIIL